MNHRSNCPGLRDDYNWDAGAQNWECAECNAQISQISRCDRLDLHIWGWGPLLFSHVGQNGTRWNKRVVYCIVCERVDRVHYFPA